MQFESMLMMGDVPNNTKDCGVMSFILLGHQALQRAYACGTEKGYTLKALSLFSGVLSANIAFLSMLRAFSYSSFYLQK